MTLGKYRIANKIFGRKAKQMENKNKKSTRVIALILTAAMILGSIGALVYLFTAL